MNKVMNYFIMLLFRTIQMFNWLIVVCFFVSFLFPDAWKCIPIKSIIIAKTRVLTLWCILVRFNLFHCRNSFAIAPSSMVDCCLFVFWVKTSPNLISPSSGKYYISMGGNDTFLFVVDCCCCIARSRLIVMFLFGGIHHYTWSGAPYWSRRASSICSD